MSTSKAKSKSHSRSEAYTDEPCSLFSITQYQCSPIGGRVTCWPIERVFRQCGQGKPALEVTNRLDGNDNEGYKVNQAFLDNPPKAKSWADIRHT